MMKYYSRKLIIFHLISLYFLCKTKLISGADCCKTLKCGGIEIKFPFRLIGREPESCGAKGFDLYCDDELRLLLELPKAGNFTVSNIIYNDFSRSLTLTDPNDCLPQKMLSLNLTTTPYRLEDQTMEFSVYNCSGNKNDDTWYRKIDCLSGSNYIVRLVNQSTTISDSNCTLLKKNVSFPTIFSLSFYYPSTIESIDLTWDNDDNKQPCYKRGNALQTSTWKQVLAIFAILILLSSCCFWGAWRMRRNNGQPHVTNHAVYNGQRTSTPSNVPRLDQVTINSYPTVVIGSSGRLIKPDDKNCCICLSDYFPGETLKLMPECLHRFHVDCIDLWLSTSASCPICRTSPSLHS